MSLRAHLRFLVTALLLAVAVGFAQPGVAQQVNPTADSVKEKQFLDALKGNPSAELQGRVTIPDTKAATLVFGLFHGFGLAAKIQEFEIARDGLLPNLLAFNVGVEIGQLLALGAILIAMGFWRRTAGFFQHAYTANVAMMCAGFMLIGYQLTGLFVS